jgi:purine-binding chemotaxis protein CheW
MSNSMEAVLESGGPDSRPQADTGPDTKVDGAVTRQFVTFQMEEETFAVPLTDVQEIIRLPAMVEVPMSASSLEGLANLRGSVLPILNLRHIFRLKDAIHDDATRVVVINNGKPVGFVVDRMARVVTAEPREIETMAGIQSTVDTDLLEGIIKRAQAMIMILDTTKLTVELNGSGARNAAAPRIASTATDDRQQNVASDEIQLVSFELENQEYALPIESVQEIVQVPDIINTIPNSQGHVLGVMNLRNRLLPLVSLRSMFGMPPTAVGDQSRIVVVAHKIGGVQQAVGLVTDTVKEVLRVPLSIVDPLPNLLSSGSGAREIDQICRMEGGKRLVSILLPDRLFADNAVRDALAEADKHEQESDMNGSVDTSGQQIDEEEQFVVFRVADEEYGVPIDAVQEIVRIPDQLTRVPKTPSFIEGVVNLRGAVLPVIDQRRRFALPDMPHNDRQRIMVFMIHGVRTGFIVDSVSEVLKISRAQISSAPDVATHEESAVSRVANIVDAKRMILMLDVERLLSKTETLAMRKAS